MKHYLALSIAFFVIIVIINAGSGAVGGMGISNTTTTLSPQVHPTGTDFAAAGAQLSGPQVTNTLSSAVQPSSSLYSTPVQTNYTTGPGALSNYQRQSSPIRTDASVYPAPQIGGPTEEQLTAESLGLFIPQMDSFNPEGELGFVPVSPLGSSTEALSTSMQAPAQPSASSSIQYPVQPTATYSAQYPVGSSVASPVQTTAPGSGIWYFPGSVVSANRLYVQTTSGFGTVGGCAYRGHLPLWADIRSSGNFFVYEWYPGQSAPYVQWLGWTNAGWRKGWFSGDVPGWHILCFNSGIWSNYVYIYVYPASASSSGLYQAPLTSGEPIPPNPGAEGLIMPDFNQYRPAGQYTQSGYYSPAQPVSAQQDAYPGVPGIAATPTATVLEQNPAIASTTIPNAAIANPALQGYPSQTISPITAGTVSVAATSAKTCTTCTSSTVIAGGVAGSCPYEGSGFACAGIAGSGAPDGYASRSCSAVYPLPSQCRCNEYYVQSCPGELKVVAGIFQGDWMPLWSKVSRPGNYWSLEWTICGSAPGRHNYCSPEVKSFGYKNTGWYQTWFKGNDPGWHILSYYCNDWSNYIYIYVWPGDWLGN
jgi:hypothetical protein